MKNYLTHVIDIGIVAGIVFLLSSCTPRIDPTTGKTPVYPIVIATDAGFTINGKKVTQLQIEPGANESYRYMYIISTVPVEAHNSVAYFSGKNTRNITTVEIP